MIYTDETINSLYEIFRKNLSISEKNIDLFTRWMNVSAPRDFSILDEIKRDERINSYFDIYERILISLLNPVLKKIDPTDEWRDRYILFMYKMYGFYTAMFSNKIIKTDPDTSYAEELLEKFYIIKNALMTLDKENASAHAAAACILTNRDINYPANLFASSEPESCIDGCILTKEYNEPNAVYLAGIAADILIESNIQKAKEAAALITSAKTDLSSVYCLSSICTASYFDNSLLEKYSEQICKEKEVIYRIIRMNTGKKLSTAALQLFSVKDVITPSFIDLVLDLDYPYNNSSETLQGSASEYLLKNHTDVFEKAIFETDNLKKAERAHKLYITMFPDKGEKTISYEDIIKEKVIDYLSEIFETPDAKEAVNNYLHEKILFSELASLNIKAAGAYHFPKYSDFFINREDELTRRTAVIMTQYHVHAPYHYYNPLNIKNQFIIDSVFNSDLPDENIIISLNNFISDFAKDDLKLLASYLEKYFDRIDSTDISKLDTNLRIIFIMLMSNDISKYRSKLLLFAADSSKPVRNELSEVLSKDPSITDEVKKFLCNKKSSVRELALDIIEKTNVSYYKEALKEAFEIERSVKLKNRIQKLCGISSEEANSNQDINVDEIVKSLTKGAKMKKSAFAFEGIIPSVHLKDGSTADTKLLTALMNCYAEDFGSKNPYADILLPLFEKDDLVNFSKAVFEKWLNNDADTKNKWILCFRAACAGNQIIPEYDTLMKKWGTGFMFSRSGLAGDTARSLVFCETNEALSFLVETSEKFRNKMVRRKALEALGNAAALMGISKDELEDKIIPDLNFSDDMSRTFDYGTRQFKVYIGKDLKPEITCSGKKLKTFPKPGENDDQILSKKSYAEYKKMNDTIKSIVKTQKKRLENCLLTARVWTKQSFDEMFLKNPVMHCFAEGLIWGMYENGRLVSSFRYLDDGSFTDSGDEPVTISENSLIGIVHPIELSEEEINAWKEQLNDYEITQPFPQLERRVFRLSDFSSDESEITVFEKSPELNPLYFCSAMEGKGFAKGCAGDAAYVYDFEQTISYFGNQKNENVRSIKAVLLTSGFCAVDFSTDPDTAFEIKTLSFKNSSSEEILLKDIPITLLSEILKSVIETSGR